MFPVSDIGLPLPDSQDVDPILISVLSMENGGPQSLLEGPVLFSPHHAMAATAPAPPVSFLDLSPLSPSEEDGATDFTEDNPISANSSIDSLFDLEYSPTSTTHTVTTPTTASSMTKDSAVSTTKATGATSELPLASTPVAAALLRKPSASRNAAVSNTVFSPVTPPSQGSTPGNKANSRPGKPIITPIPFSGTEGNAQAKPADTATKSKTVEPPKASASSRRYKITQPSKFCHVCVRSGELVALAPCANVLTGVCRKAICRRCFDKHGRGDEWAHARENSAILARATTAGRGGPSATAVPPSAWTCLHCRGLCPENAQCKIYARTNRRRHLLLKQRKAEKACTGSPELPRGVACPGVAKNTNGSAVGRRAASGHLPHQLHLAQAPMRMFRAPPSVQPYAHQMGGHAQRLPPQHSRPVLQHHRMHPNAHHAHQVLQGQDFRQAAHVAHVHHQLPGGAPPCQKRMY